MKNDTYLFDWGDTLMVDFPEIPGKMCNWDVVEAVHGAGEALKHLSNFSEIYIATGAKESTESEIRSAFERVGLAQYISGYFCRANLGVEKGSPAFLLKILKQLNKRPAEVTMVGNSLKADIEPAIKAGIKAVWLCENKTNTDQPAYRVIYSLKELCS